METGVARQAQARGWWLADGISSWRGILVRYGDVVRRAEALTAYIYEKLKESM